MAVHHQSAVAQCSACMTSDDAEMAFEMQACSGSNQLHIRFRLPHCTWAGQAPQQSETHQAGKICTLRVHPCRSQTGRPPLSRSELCALLSLHPAAEDYSASTRSLCSADIVSALPSLIRPRRRLEGACLLPSASMASCVPS